MRNVRKNENYFRYEPELFTSRWPFEVRASVFIFGLGSLLLSTKTSGFTRKFFTILGFASLIRATTNLFITHLVGAIANPVIRLSRTIHTPATVTDVYHFLSDFSNYSRFMSYVQNVSINPQGGLLWSLTGPAGLKVSWNTRVTQMTPNQRIRWQSTDTSLIRNSGDIQLTDLLEKGTQIQVELTYAPPAGVFGYALVHFLGFDPRDRIDEDLTLLKKILIQGIESSITSRPGSQGAENSHPLEEQTPSFRDRKKKDEVAS